MVGSALSTLPAAAVGGSGASFPKPWRVPVETLQVWRPVEFQPTGDRFYVLPRTDGQFAICDRRLTGLGDVHEVCATIAALKAAIAKLPADDA